MCLENCKQIRSENVFPSKFEKKEVMGQPFSFFNAGKFQKLIDMGKIIAHT